MSLEIQPCTILKMKTGFLNGLKSLFRAAQCILHTDMSAKSLIVSLQPELVVPEDWTLRRKTSMLTLELFRTSLEEGSREGNESGSAGGKQCKF